MGLNPGVYFDSDLNQFTLQGKSSSYVFRITNSGLLEHLHWGEGVHGDVVDDLSYLSTDSNVISFDAGEKNSKMLEFSDYGTGDFRTPSFHVRLNNGTWITPVKYKNHQIIPGKPTIEITDPTNPQSFLPLLYATTEEATSLIVTLEDLLTGIEVNLHYTIFHQFDILTRRTVINSKHESVSIESLQSATVDFPQSNACGGDSSFHFTHLSGAWARERHLETRPLGLGTASISSKRGVSSHQHNPFAVISRGPYHEDQGEHFAFNLVYSGNFMIEAEVVQTGRLRVNTGINPFNFRWELNSNGSFLSPEVVLAYSNHGMGEISRQLHKLYQTNLIRGYWRDLPRPILVNSWEAMYFAVTHEKIINNLAIPASELGIELVVLDDGWFGKRNSDRTSLGDWYVNELKFPQGLGPLATEVNDLGLMFGIWMEPEMISVDSDLYRAHPDWALHVGDRPRTEGRNQLVLDMGREDVRNYIVDAVSNVLSSGNIEYLKWDFNRHLTEIASESFSSQQQGEVTHRFILGTYEIMERITSRFPKVLFESCSGGGGRFDPGMLYYMPQVWTSDNTDAISRAKIQYGTSLPYPAISMGAHVSVVPNHQNGRITSLQLRTFMAFGGNFGYELDLLKLSLDEKVLIKSHTNLYRDIESIVRLGIMYRLSSPFSSGVTSWMYVLPDQTRAAVFAFNTNFYENVWNYPRLKLKGLQSTSTYKVVPQHIGFNLQLTGQTLMSAGLVLSFSGDAGSNFWILEKQ